MKKKNYATAEICEMFGISKSTLFRWEREGLLPPVPRDIGGQRKYGETHIRLISERQKAKLGRLYKQIAETEDETEYWAFSEALALTKFLEGDPTGLSELLHHPHVSDSTLMQLLKIAVEEYHPGDQIFQEIIRVVYEHSQPGARE